MSPHDTRPEHPAAVLGAGLAAILAGVALLLQAIGAMPIGWDLVLPLMLLVVGAVTATTGIVGAARTDHH